MRHQTFYNCNNSPDISLCTSFDFWASIMCKNYVFLFKFLL